MSDLRVEEVEEKNLRISGIDPFLAVCLYEVPEIVGHPETYPGAETTGETARCLYPDPTDKDAAFNAEWLRLVVPELQHLFVSAVETFSRDLTGLRHESPETDYRQVTFPAAHASAWVSALNQARLILAELFGVDEMDIGMENFDLDSAKQRAVLKIHLFGYLLQLFVDRESGPAS